MSLILILHVILEPVALVPLLCLFLRQMPIPDPCEN